MKTLRTTCKIGACEPFCGMEVDVEDGKMVGVRPDRGHPITKGYACIKGMHIADYQNDPDRLLHPQKRVDGGFENTDWDTAIADVGRKLRAIVDESGPTAIATYWGNAADSTAILLANSFCHAWGSPNSFNVLSLEYTDRGAVAERMLGNENYILQPDAGNASFALLLGTNPLVTQGMTLLQRRPRINSDFAAIKKRGGKVVVVDPRETESARAAQEHIAIRPGTDFYLLLGMIRHIIEERLYDQKFIERHCSHFDELRTAAFSVDLTESAGLTDVPENEIRRLANEFAQAKSGFACTRVGVQTSRNSTLTEWAVIALNAITGNIDREGGLYFNPGAVDVPELIKKFTKRRNPAPSRVGSYPQIFGGPPASVFSDDVLSDDPDRIRALIVVAGNPVITFPNTPKIEKALEKLDLLVCIDIYRSDTGAFADYNLPAKTIFEKGAFHFLTSNFEPYPFAEWKPPVAQSRGEARTEWEMFRDISRAAGVPFLNDPALDRIDRFMGLFGKGFTEEMLFNYLLMKKGGLRKLKKSARGIKYGDIQWGHFLEARLETPDKRINLAPSEFVNEVERLNPGSYQVTEKFPYVLISGARRLASYNSWTHNIPALMDKMEGNWATMHPDDIEALGLSDGNQIRIETEAGCMEIEVRSSPEIRTGVVSVQQFWGHNYDSSTMTSRAHPGVNVNLVHDDRDLDPFSGMPCYNGRRCRIEQV